MYCFIASGWHSHLPGAGNNQIRPVQHQGDINHCMHVRGGACVRACVRACVCACGVRRRGHTNTQRERNMPSRHLLSVRVTCGESVSLAMSSCGDTTPSHHRYRQRHRDQNVIPNNLEPNCQAVVVMVGVAAIVTLTRLPPPHPLASSQRQHCQQLKMVVILIASAIAKTMVSLTASAVAVGT